MQKVSFTLMFLLLSFNFLIGQGMVTLVDIEISPETPTTDDSIHLSFTVYHAHHVYQVSFNYEKVDDMLKIKACYIYTGFSTTSKYTEQLDLGLFEFGEYDYQILIYASGNPDSCTYHSMEKDTTGSFTVDWPVTIDGREQSSTGIELHPNPSTGNQNLRINLENPEQVAIKLYDIHGKKIKNIFAGRREAGVSEQDIDLSELPGGVYFYRVTVGEKVFFRKVVKL